MNQKLVNLINKTATFKNIVLLGVLFLITAFFIMPEATKQIKQYAGETNLVDGKFHYSSVEIYQMIAAYGEKGRSLYLVVELTADLFFSIVTAAFLGALLIWTAFRSRNRAIKIKYLLGLPVFLLIANILENASIVWMLFNYPDQYSGVPLATSITAFAKWVLIFICVVLLLWNLLRIVLSKSGIFQNATVESTVSNHI